MGKHDSLETGGDTTRGRDPRPRDSRQARVGILPNPNQPAEPPRRRPPLVGKWMPLRSSRRPPDHGADMAAGETLTGDLAAPEPGTAPADSLSGGATTTANGDMIGRVADRLNRTALGPSYSAPPEPEASAPLAAVGKLRAALSRLLLRG